MATRTADPIKVATKTFTAPIVREYSARSSVDELGTHESTMDLFLYPTELSGFIEWEIPTADEHETIGLWFEQDPRTGVRTLVDYDGVMSLPTEAVELLREAGAIVSNEYDERAVFRFGEARMNYWDLRDELPAIEDWAAHAKPGEVCPTEPTVMREAA